MKRGGVSVAVATATAVNHELERSMAAVDERRYFRDVALQVRRGWSLFLTGGAGETKQEAHTRAGWANGEWRMGHLFSKACRSNGGFGGLCCVATALLARWSCAGPTPAPRL